MTLNNGAISTFSISSAAPNPSGPAQIATSGGAGGNSLSFPGGAVDIVNVSGTATVNQVFDLFSYTGMAPTLANFSLGTMPNIPGVAFKIDLTTMNQVDLIAISSNTDHWTNNGANGQWDIGGTLNWATTLAPTTPSYYGDGDNVVFDDTNSLSGMTFGSNQSITVASPVNPQSVVFNNNTISYTVGGAAITGAGSLTVSGGGSVTLTGSGNTYSGGTLITNGTLILGASSTPTSGTVTSGPVGTSAVTLGAGNGSSPATLYLGAASSTGGLTVANAITVQSGSSGLMTIGGQNISGTNTFSGNITMNQGALSCSAARWHSLATLPRGPAAL